MLGLALGADPGEAIGDGLESADRRFGHQIIWENERISSQFLGH